MPRGRVSYREVDDTSKDVFETSPYTSFYMTFVKNKVRKQCYALNEGNLAGNKSQTVLKP
jgi:hypothetical protein